MKINLNEKIEEYDEVFDFIEENQLDLDLLVIDGHIKIKTTQDKVQFAFIEQVLQKFNLKITEISFTDYYGIIFGIEKLETI